MFWSIHRGNVRPFDHYYSWTGKLEDPFIGWYYSYLENGTKLGYVQDHGIFAQLVNEESVPIGLQKWKWTKNGEVSIVEFHFSGCNNTQYNCKEGDW